MKKALVLLFLVLAAGVQAQDFLGKWTVNRIFTTGAIDRNDDNRMMVLVHQGPREDSRIDGVLLPRGMTVEFSINPNNQAQHVTLSNEGLLLMSLNWKARGEAVVGSPLDDLTLKVWSVDEGNYGIFSILYNDEKTLVFSDRSRAGSQYLDIYQMTKVD